MNSAWSPARLIALVVVAAAAIAATVDRGGFFAPVSTACAAAALVAIVLVLVVDRGATVHHEDVALLALAGWWWVAAVVHHVAGSFVPLGASILLAAATAATVRAVDARWRRGVQVGAVALGAAVAAVGLVGCCVRWYPEAIRGQDLWRLAGSIGYSNATGLLLAMALLLAVAPDARCRATPLVVATLLAGLVATESKGALLALVVGAAWLSWRELRMVLPALISGAAGGLVVVATASGSAPRPIVLVPLAACLVLAQLAPAWTTTARTAAMHRSTRAICWVAIGVVAVALVALASHEVATRVDAGSASARLREWRAALDQFGSSPVDGVGPDRLLVGSTGAASYFAHNEYLQVLAGGGLVAFALLAAAFERTMRCLARRGGTEAGSRASLGALAAFATGGLVDYSWHVPAVACVAGVAVGLAHHAALRPNGDRRPWRALTERP